MLANNLELKGGTYDDMGEFDIGHFVLIDSSNLGSTRILAESTLGLPTKMQIKHSLSGKADSLIDRHLVSFTKTKLAGTVPVVATLNFTLSVPRAGDVFNTVDIAGMCRFLTNLLGFATTTETEFADIQTTLNALLRGES
jgi:hypothetical protein